MTKETSTYAPENKKKAIFWMLFPVLLLVTSVSGWLFMVSIAVDDPGFAVEPDYYKKAANYDAVIDQRVENSRLGYRLAVESFAISGPGEARLVLRAEDRLGVSLADAAVAVIAMPIARAFDVQELSLQRAEDGSFEATLLRPRAGLWEMRVTVEHGGRVFTEVLRPELALAGPSKSGGAERGGPPS